MKKTILLLVTLSLILLTLTACGTSKTYVDVSDKIYLGYSNDFETQAVAEALLASKGVPYTVVDAGTTSRSYLAEVNAEYFYGENVQTGYYVNKDETVVLKVFTYVEPETPDPTPTPTDVPDPATPDVTATPDSTDPTDTPAPTASASTYDWKEFLKDYEEWVDDYVALMKKYQANPTDLSLLNDYLAYMEKLVEWAEKIDEVELELADSPEALKEYLETLARILLKLSDIG